MKKKQQHKCYRKTNTCKNIEINTKYHKTYKQTQKLVKMFKKHKLLKKKQKHMKICKQCENM